MAGTLTISTLSDGTNSTSATNCIQGSAKAWVNFNGTGTVAIRASYNVSSITDNGTGDYTINFTNALADANYSIAGYSRSTASGNTTSCISGTSNSSVTSSACRILNIDLNTSAAHNAGSDSDFINLSFFR
jgi:hypothetical protein